MSPQSKPRKLPHRWRITLTILTLVLIPYIILASVFYKNAREEWISSALSTYYNEAETSGLHLSNTFSEMQSKMHYLANNSTIRTLISRVEYLTLPLAIDMIDELENAVSAITVDSPALVVRWYPLKTDRTYGTYCYPFQLFKDEFDSNIASDTLLYGHLPVVDYFSAHALGDVLDRLIYSIIHTDPMGVVVGSNVLVSIMGIMALLYILSQIMPLDFAVVSILLFTRDGAFGMRSAQWHINKYSIKSIPRCWVFVIPYLVQIQLSFLSGNCSFHCHN